METVFVLLMMTVGLSHAIETHCDARQNGTQCYAALGGTVGLRLVERFETERDYQLQNNKLEIIFKVKNNNTLIPDREYKDRSSFDVSSGTFKISDIARRDDAHYVLEITDGSGHHIETKHLPLSVQAPVSLPKALSPECLSRRQMRVSCSSEGDSVQYSWTLDGQTLRDQQLLSGHHDTQDITLPLGTSGLLLCSVSNNVSRDAVGKNISSCLAAPVSAPRLSPECLSQGQMRVSCSSEGDSVQYSWTLDGQALSGHQDTNTTTLTLGTSGLLICVVYNNFSRAAVGKNLSPCPGFRFINCTSSNGTQIPPQWVFDNDTQCMTPVPLDHGVYVYIKVAEMCVLLVVCVGFYIYYKMKTRPPPKQDPLYSNMVVMETQ